MTYIFTLILVSFAVRFFYKRLTRVKKSGYHKSSGNSILKTVSNKGNYGEFLVYKELEGIEGYNRLLTNLYLPKRNGTTEVDLVMISETGIYVFEVKNYSGWIYGDESYKTWVQVFPTKRKEKFFNPVWQNGGHITALKYILNSKDNALFKSYIVFGAKCTLKDVKIKSENVSLVQMHYLKDKLVNSLKSDKKILTRSQVDEIYEILNRYSHASDEAKREHIKRIKERLHS